ncbi:hypothetical protein JCM5353_000720 [Sporobolomyces roseus]
MSDLAIPPLPPFTSLKPPSAITNSIHSVSSLLGTSLRLTVPSTCRQFIGTFVCIDPQGNLVLDQAREWEIELNEGKVQRRIGEGREVGLVLIKKEIWGSIERVRTEEEVIKGEEKQATGCTPS